MSEGNTCRLCLNICKHYRGLYDKNAKPTEVYSFIIKYLDSTILNMELGQHLTSVCLKCWYNLLNFNTFAQSVAAAQTKLNCDAIQNEIDITINSEDSSMNDAIQIKNEEEFICLPETEPTSILHHTNFSIEFIAEDYKTTPSDDNDDNHISDDFLVLNANAMDDIQDNVIIPELEVVKERHDLNLCSDIKENPQVGATLSELEVLEVHDDVTFCSDDEKLQNRTATMTVNDDNESGNNIQIKYHNNQPEFKCEICGKFYATCRLLTDHLLIKHSGVKVKRMFKCPKCPFRYSTDDKFKLHMAKHINCEYECTQCGKAFSSDNRRLLHERWTHGINRLCKFCGKTLRDNKNFTQHLLEHNEYKDTDEPLHVCTVCGQITKTASDMRTHMESHSQMESLECSYCSKTFQHRSTLRTHLRNKHSIEMPCKRTSFIDTLSSYISSPTEES